MGITLSGTKPKDTYQSLLKTADNLILDSVLRVISDGSGNDSSLLLSVNRVGISADSSVTTQSVAVIESTSTNSGLVLQPNGTGAIMAQVPDGTAAGGNARGQYAVDLQMARLNPGEVASGDYSFIGSGIGNDVSGPYSFIGSGYNNDNAGSYAFIGGGHSHSLTGAYQTIAGGYNNSITSIFSTSSFIGGGEANSITAGAGQTNCVIAGGQSNVVSRSHSTISGGQSNTASTNTHATVVGGSSNTSSGQYSVSGGYNNVASGAGAVALGYNSSASNAYSVAIGENCTASAGRSYVIGTNSSTGGSAARSGIFSSSGSSIDDQYSAIAGGSENTISLGSRNSFIGGGLQNQILNYYGSAIGGRRAKSYLYNHSVNASGNFSATGDAQQSTVVARKSATLASAATTVLSLDGTGTTHLIIPDGNDRAWNVTVKWVAVVTSITGTATGVSVGDIITQVNTLGFKRVSGTSSVVGSVNTISTNNDTSMATASMGYTAGGSQQLALTFTAPTFTGGGSVTCRVVAKVELTEVAW